MNHKENIMTKFFVITLAALSLLSLTACNTMEGLGEDIKKGGEKLEKAAKKNN